MRHRALVGAGAALVAAAGVSAAPAFGQAGDVNNVGNFGQCVANVALTDGATAAQDFNALNGPSTFVFNGDKLLIPPGQAAQTQTAACSVAFTNPPPGP